MKTKKMILASFFIASGLILPIIFHSVNILCIHSVQQIVRGCYVSGTDLDSEAIKHDALCS